MSYLRSSNSTQVMKFLQKQMQLLKHSFLIF